MKHALVLVVASLVIPSLLLAQARPLPGNDVVTVEIPQKVKVGDKVLEPGEYTFKEHMGPMHGESTTLFIYKDDQVVVETTVLTAPTGGGGEYAEETKLTLKQVGNDFYLDQLWVTGKQFGYQFTPPEGLPAKVRQDESSDSQQQPSDQSGSQQSRE